MVAMNSVPLYILSISIGVIVMSLNLMLATSPTSPTSLTSPTVQSKQLGVSRSFVCIGSLLILVSILTSITVLTIPHLYFSNGHYDLTYNIYNPVVLMTLTLSISGLLALSNSGSTWRSFGLFILSFVILGSCIFMVIQMSDVYPQHVVVTDEMNLSDSRRMDIPVLIFRFQLQCWFKNNTDLCVKYLER
jgi:hypothetical protein